MCPNRDWLSSFEELDDGTVFMGNDNASKTKGIDKIRLKLHDGTIRVLRDVQYVPDLKKKKTHLIGCLKIQVLQGYSERWISKGGFGCAYSDERYSSE